MLYCMTLENTIEAIPWFITELEQWIEDVNEGQMTKRL